MPELRVVLRMLGIAVQAEQAQRRLDLCPRARRSRSMSALLITTVG